MTDSTETTSADAKQQDVTAWFDHTYETAGFEYLRPLAAYPIFLQLLEARAGAQHLDVACGPGLLLKASAMRGLKPTGLDVSRSALDIAEEYVPEASLHQGNAEQLPFKDEEFDYITCVGAIERFFDRRAALQEMIRVARPDARLCFMVRNSATLTWLLWCKLLRQKNTTGHQDALDRDQWETLFNDVGLDVLSVYADQWPRQRLRRLVPGERARDLSTDEKIAEPLIPMRYVNEFIFILKKRGAESA